MDATHTNPPSAPADPGAPAPDAVPVIEAARDLAAIPAVELLLLHATDLMTASAVRLGLFEGGDEHRDLAEARILIDVTAGFVKAAVPHLGSAHAAPLRDGVKTLQLAFREASSHPDAAGDGPGERHTGPVYAS
jgi:hypothetical protein